MAAGESRQHAGNAGYDDQIDAFYSWDNTVAHHADLRAGDPIAIWDKNALLGVSVIEAIFLGAGEKIVRKCPFCHMASIKARSTLIPAFRCHTCGRVFDSPEERVRLVQTYRALYAASWIDLSSALTGPELRNVCVSQKSQQSLRPLEWQAFTQALHARVPARITRRVKASIDSMMSAEGHRQVLTRARRGQTAFRSNLLQRFGENCAITGPSPAVTLEAAHLYSYAELGVHHEHGGLLLRRDVHRLFDRGDVAVHPKSLLLDVDPYVSSFDNYKRLHGQRIRTRIGNDHRAWMERHWAQHREDAPSMTA